MTNDEIHISFVMPSYNSEKTITEAVESIYNGNFEDGDEVIVVDNASTDNTRNIITKMVTRYSTLIQINNPKNVGCPASRNIGVKRAKNQIIFNLDSDNILAPGSIKKLKDYLLSENADMAAFAEYHYFHKKNKEVTHKWICNPGVMTLADFMAGPINPGPGGNFMYTKKSWEKIGGYWEYGQGVNEAWGYTLKHLVNGSKIVVLKDSYYLHRYGIKSLFIREAKDNGKSSIMATKMISNFINLINDDDATYIMSQEGQKSWYEMYNFLSRPIRLKTGEKGITGYKITIKENQTVATRLNRLLPMRLYYIVRKMYRFYIFKKDFYNFKKISDRTNRFVISWNNRKAQLFDKTPTTEFDTHYIYHPAWAARIVKIINPEYHVDISSTLSFATIVSAFIPVHFYDYRPAKLSLYGLTSERGSFPVLPIPDNSIHSISCMHTIEHVGLGRYGEPIDPDGDIKAINDLKRVVSTGGNILFVVPIGKPKIVFNAHRIYSYEQIMSYFNEFELKEFSLIPDNAREAGMIYDADPKSADNQNYGCGCFWFIKK